MPPNDFTTNVPCLFGKEILLKISVISLMIHCFVYYSGDCVVCISFNSTTLNCFTGLK